jgi:hypothetical protein
VALLGAGFGADLAYAGSARGWGGVSTVCVSLDEDRARVLAGAGTFAPRGVYLMYGADDPESVRSAESFAATAAVPSERYPYGGTAKTGLALWAERQPEILARSIAWIEKTT